MLKTLLLFAFYISVYGYEFYGDVSKFPIVVEEVDFGDTISHTIDNNKIYVFRTVVPETYYQIKDLNIETSAWGQNVPDYSRTVDIFTVPEQSGCNGGSFDYRLGDRTVPSGPLYFVFVNEYNGNYNNYEISYNIDKSVPTVYRLNGNATFSVSNKDWYFDEKVYAFDVPPFTEKVWIRINSTNYECAKAKVYYNVFPRHSVTDDIRTESYISYPRPGTYYIIMSFSCWDQADIDLSYELVTMENTDIPIFTYDKPLTLEITDDLIFAKVSIEKEFVQYSIGYDILGDWEVEMRYQYGNLPSFDDSDSILYKRDNYVCSTNTKFGPIINDKKIDIYIGVKVTDSKKRKSELFTSSNITLKLLSHCNKNCVNGECDFESGLCVCENGWEGDTCGNVVIVRFTILMFLVQFIVASFFFLLSIATTIYSLRYSVKVWMKCVTGGWTIINGCYILFSVFVPNDALIVQNITFWIVLAVDLIMTGCYIFIVYSHYQDCRKNIDRSSFDRVKNESEEAVEMEEI